MAQPDATSSIALAILRDVPADAEARRRARISSHERKGKRTRFRCAACRCTLRTSTGEDGTTGCASRSRPVRTPARRARQVGAAKGSGGAKGWSATRTAWRARASWRVALGRGPRRPGVLTPPPASCARAAAAGAEGRAARGIRESCCASSARDAAAGGGRRRDARARRGAPSHQGRSPAYEPEAGRGRRRLTPRARRRALLDTCGEPAFAVARWGRAPLRAGRRM